MTLSKYITILLCGFIFINISLSKAEKNETAPYEDLLQHRTGFAKNVTGGAGGKVIIINKLDCSLLRMAVTGNEPKWIRFKPGLKGKIEIEGNLFIGSNTTIDGRDADITLTSPDDCDGILFWGKDKHFNDVQSRRNLIVHNIKIIKVGKGNNCGQGLGIAFNAKDVWVDHVTFSGNGDESLSTGKGATDLTVTWCKFIDTDKAILLSWGDDGDELLDKNTFATIHHCYFLRVNGRCPAMRFGKAHYYNNLLESWGWCGVGVTMGGELYSENNIYGKGRWNNSPPALSTKTNQWAPNPGFIKSVGDRFLNLKKGIDSQGPGINTGKVFKPGNLYKYKTDPPDDKLMKILRNNTGWSANPQWSSEN